MKTLKKINLKNKYKKIQLNRNTMNTIIGGAKEACCCACAYANSGGSSVMGNFTANDAGGLHSPGCTPMD